MGSSRAPGVSLVEPLLGGTPSPSVAWAWAEAGGSAPVSPHRFNHRLARRRNSTPAPWFHSSDGSRRDRRARQGGELPRRVAPLPARAAAARADPLLLRAPRRHARRRARGRPARRTRRARAGGRGVLHGNSDVAGARRAAADDSRVRPTA